MRRLLALAVVGVLPWTFVIGPGGVELVFLWGLANPATLHVVTVWDYLFVLTSGLPNRLLAWPASTLLYAGGLVAALADERDFGDVRLTVGLLGLAGLAHLGFAVGVARRGTVTVVPVGPILVGITIWWFYWPAIRSEFARER